MDDTTVSWLAALIDGEGSIMLTARRKQANWRPQVTISNTDFRLMEALSERTGGGVVYQHKRQPKENHKLVAYTWRMRVAEIKLWLPLVMPWLVCKKEQAVLLLEAVELKATLAPTKGRSMEQTIQQRDRVREKVQTIAAEISSLNRRGRMVPTIVSPLP